ncbi:hypothetical protein NDU88_002015 [Pleurodeles waltl]|uniref:Uncharacterized protein n=1 Tax=Pleurodeles waltl TaxID=8319 RepID=A0AAV7P5J0_PLEWA|nr:hypothetical protein NDU88_002015 [Pleurodeles waltl]
MFVIGDILPVNMLDAKSKVVEVMRLLMEVGRLDLMVGGKEHVSATHSNRRASARMAAVVAVCSPPRKKMAAAELEPEVSVMGRPVA